MLKTLLRQTAEPSNQEFSGNTLRTEEDFEENYWRRRAANFTCIFSEIRERYYEPAFHQRR